MPYPKLIDANQLENEITERYRKLADGNNGCETAALMYVEAMDAIYKAPVIAENEISESWFRIYGDDLK